MQKKPREKGRKIYHLNIGQPDIKTPDVMLNAIQQLFRDILLNTVILPELNRTEKNLPDITKDIKLKLTLPTLSLPPVDQKRLKLQ